MAHRYLYCALRKRGIVRYGLMVCLVLAGTFDHKRLFEKVANLCSNLVKL
jgi:hypothetical protein